MADEAEVQKPWIWWPEGGMPQEPGYTSSSGAKEAVMAYLAARNQVGVTDPAGGGRWYWDNEWRPLEAVPEGFTEGFELYIKHVRTGQQVLRRRDG